MNLYCRPILIAICAMLLQRNNDAQAQGTAPDMKSMERAVNAPNSPCFWPELKRRYDAGDSSLDQEQRRCLYYGRTFQTGYSAYGRSDYEDSVRAVLKNDVMLSGDWARVLHFTDSVIVKTPFNLRFLNYRARAARELQNRDVYDRTITQLKTVGNAIQSTGDGLSATTAYWVTSVADEYSMIIRLGYTFGGKQSLVDGPCDRMTLEPGDGAPEALYFNVSLLFGQMEKMFSEGSGKQKKRR